MKDNLSIFYAFKRSDSEVRKFCKEHGIKITKHATGVDMIFIDVDDDRHDLDAVLIVCENNPGATVYLFQHNQLGVGAKAKQMREELEKRGASVVVPERILGKRGPKPTHGLTLEQIERYRPLYEKKTVTRQHVVDVILRDTGYKTTRHQLRTIFKK